MPIPNSEKIAFLIFLLVVGGIYFLEGALLIRFVKSRRRGQTKPNILLKKPAIVLHLVALAGIFVLPIKIK